MVVVVLVGVVVVGGKRRRRVARARGRYRHERNAAAIAATARTTGPIPRRWTAARTTGAATDATRDVITESSVIRRVPRAGSPQVTVLRR